MRAAKDIWTQQDCEDREKLYKRNCYNEGDHKFRFPLGGGLILNECPATYITPDSIRFIDLFWLCHNEIGSGYGVSILETHLPRQGGVLMQDNITMEAFHIIRAEAMQVINAPPKEKKP